MGEKSKCGIPKKLDFNLHLSDEFYESMNSDWKMDTCSWQEQPSTPVDSGHQMLWTDSLSESQLNGSPTCHVGLQLRKQKHASPKPAAALFRWQTTTPENQIQGTVNINPFTPNGRTILSKKRSRSKTKPYSFDSNTHL